MSGASTPYTVGVPYAIPVTVVQELSSVALTGTLATPEKGNVDATNLSGENVDVLVTWNPELGEGNKFAAGTAYTATIKVTPKKGYVFAENASVTLNGEDFTSDGEGCYILTKTFDETEAKSLTGLTVTACNVTGKTAGDTLTKDDLTVKATYDDGSEDVNYTDYEIEYANGDTLQIGDTFVEVKSGRVTAKATFEAIQGKTAGAELFTFTAPELTYDATDRIEDIKGAVQLKDGYDGKIGTPTVTVKQGDTVVAEAVNAGKYDVYVSCAAGSIYGAVEDLKLGEVTIDQLVAVLEWQNAETRTYDGKPSNVTAVVANLVGEDQCTVTVTGGDAIKADTHTATAEALDNANYKLPQTATREYTIETVKVAAPTAVEQTYTYDGTEKTFALNGFDANTMNISGNKQTNAGTYTVTVALKDQENYEWKTGGTADKTYTFTIAKAAAPTDVKAAFKVFYRNAAEQTVSISDFDLPDDIANPRFEGSASTATGADVLQSHGNNAFQLKENIQKDQIGSEVTWTVTIASDNYENITAAVTVKVVTIDFTVNGEPATASNAVTLAASPTYGQTWDELVTVKGDSIVAKLLGETLQGTYKLNKTGIPGAGQQRFAVFFTDNDHRYEDILVLEGKVTVAPKAIVVTVTPVTLEYGAAIPAFEATVADGALVGQDTVAGLNLALTTTATSTSLPGKYDVTGATDGNPNYTVTINGTNALTITKAALTLTGTPAFAGIKANDAKNASAETLLAAVQAANETLSASYANGTTTLDAVWSLTSGTWDAKGGTYTYTAALTPTNGECFSFAASEPVTVSVTVSAVNATLSLPKTAVTKAMAALDAAQTYAEMGLPTEIQVAYDNGVAAATYPIIGWDKTIQEIQDVDATEQDQVLTLTPSFAEPEWATLGTVPTFELTVTDKYPVDVEWTQRPTDITYGDALTAPVAQQVAIDNGVDETATFVYTYTGTTAAGETYNSTVAPTAAGSYTVTAAVVSATHSGKVSADFTIAKRTAVLTWNNAETRAYDGQASAVTAAVANLVGEDQCTVTVTGGTETNAGTHTATAEALDNTNYVLPENATKSYTIDKLVAELQWNNAETRTYNGQASAVTAEVTNLVGQDACTVTVTGGTETNAGTHTATATALSNTNYALPQTVTKSYIIETVKVTAPTVSGTYTYNGTEQTAVLAGFDEATMTVSGNTRTNAGTYTVTVALKDKANYEWAPSGTADKTLTFTIAKKTAALEWTGAGTLYYDGRAKSVTAAVSNLEAADAGKVSVTVVGGTQTAIGNYTATATDLTGEKAANYQLPSERTQSFTIQAAVTSVTVTPSTVTAVIDGLTIKLVGYLATDGTITVDGHEIPAEKKMTFHGVEYTIDDSGVERIGGAVTVNPAAPSVPTEPSAEAEEAGVTQEVINALGASTVQDMNSAVGGLVANIAQNAPEGATQVQIDLALKIEPKAFGDGKLKLEIKPEVTVTYQDAEGAPVGTSETTTIANSDIQAPITIKIKLPDGMPHEHIFAKHALGGGRFEYLATNVDQDGDSYYYAEWQQRSFSEVELLQDTRSATITFTKADGTVQTITYGPSDIGTALPTDSKSGNTFKGWSINGHTYSGTLTDEMLTAINGAYSATGDFEPIRYIGGGGGSVATYSVKIGKDVPVTAKPASASEGDTVTLTVKAGALDGKALSVTDANGKAVKLTKVNDTTYTFVMPASAVTVSLKDAKPAMNFTDVPNDFWAHDAIQWAFENGYVKGKTEDTYMPAGTVTRQQIWMIMARMAGEDPADMAAAKAWAMSKGLTDGSNPTASVTRQQMVAMLYRYSTMQGYTAKSGADLNTFPDANKVAGYAQEAMQWSVANNVVGGTAQGTLDPSGNANRAQFAVILYRFAENVVK